MLMKWIFDRVFALLGLICLVWVFPIVAILICLTMPDGPIIYSQKRVGKDGRLFTMHKFRSMSSGDESNPISVSGDSRITPLGAILRRFKIDELPQLWDVLIGKMSFVGPRPDVPGYADMLSGDDRIILKLRPGITGPATLKYRDEEELLAQVDDPQKYNDEVIYPDKVRINKYYYNNYSFFVDVKIVMATILGKHIYYNGELI